MLAVCEKDVVRGHANVLAVCERDVVRGHANVLAVCAAVLAVKGMW